MDTFTFLLIISAALFHALWNFFTKKIKVDRTVVLWLGQWMVGLAVLPLILFFADYSSISWESIPYIIFTGIFHALYFYLLGWSYSIGDVSTVYPISRGTGIIGTTIIALFLEVEHVSFTGMVGVMVLILGILLIGLKHGLHRRLVLLSALMVGMTISLYSVVDKLGVKLVPAFLYIAVMFVSTAIFLSPAIYIQKRKLVRNIIKNHKMYSFCIGCAIMGTYCLILLAFQNAPASYVVALREVSIVVASILGIVFMKEEVTTFKICGIFMILIGAIIIKFA